MNMYAFSSLIAFFICLFLGLFVYSRGRNNSVNKSFALVTIITGAWSLFPFVANLPLAEEPRLLLGRLIYIAASLTPTFFLKFVLIFVNEAEKRTQKNIIFASYAISIFFLFNLFNPLFIKDIISIGFSKGIVAGPLYFGFILFFGVICLYAFYKVLQTSKHAVGAKRNQLKYIFAGFGIAFISGLVHFLPTFKIPEPFPHDFLVIAYSLIMAYSIVAHRLMDVNVVITRGVAYGGLTAIVAGAYIGLMALIDRAFAALPGYSPALAHSLLFIAVLFALIYILPEMKVKALEVTRQTLFRGRYDYQQELTEAARIIPTMLNMAQLCEYVLSKIKETMRVEKLSMFVYDNAEQVYQPAFSFGLEKEAINQIKIGENSALAGLLREAAKPLVKEELTRTNITPDQAGELAIQQLNSLDAELCIPLILKDDLSGIVALGHKKSGEMYTEEDLSLLATLANQAALAIEYIKAIDKISSEKRYVGLGKASMRMAHDIKNPLVPVKTFLQVLPDKYPREFAKMGKLDAEFTGRFYESALEGVDRINNLIERALHYARHPQPQFASLKLDKLMEDVLIQAEVDLKKAEIKLQKQYEPAANEIDADSEQLMELFSNLVSNAIDAMEEAKSKTLTVETHILGARVAVEIGDSGCGIPKERIDSIFDPFITYKHKGSGLGLAIAKKIVDDHKGSIEVASFPGQGTTFKVILPKKQRDS